jgi:plastocyanin
MFGRWLVFAGLAGYLLTALHPVPATAVHEVQMGSRSGTRFEPATTTARAGDTVRFINGDGGPHNVQFFADSILDPARDLLDKAMPGEKLGWLASQLFLERNEVYEIVVPKLAPGRYPFVCLPHYAAGMTGAIVVAP